MDEKPSDQEPASSYDPYEAPEDPAERRAWIEAALKRSHEEYIRALREEDKALEELDKEKGILERLFGYRTSV